MTIQQVSELDGGQGFKNLINVIAGIMQTNDNMAILWYMRNLYKTGQELGYVG
ncbi:MAG: hypothetical protein ISP82_02395 [Candidatus Poseidoniaceae archaeon]|nr:hypothetical protein [Candidatus Poseidoniaceae archaeon]MBL6896090.1 hypothetical protein [Candidatus Poseidoniaceae archaeon]